jgi:hypothetical protein
MKRRTAGVALLLSGISPGPWGCDRHAPSPSAGGVGATAAASSEASVSATPATQPPRGVPCGALDCAQYDSPSDAFQVAIGGAPRVLGVGEAHAPKGATAPSAAKHFTDELLPLLAGRASDLLVELMTPPAGCADVAAKVRRQQAPVTSRQAETDQGEYVAMGERARALGVVPDLLRPTCADMDAVHAAADGAIDASLSLIARLSAAQAGRLVDRDERSDADRAKTVVVYGGMLHNDLAPPPDRAAWSYAPALDARTGGRFVAVDLVVPEYIGDDESWRAFAWWSHYDRARLGGKTTLFRTGERSYVLVFAVSSR